jgi:glycerol-3-phosphate dehydrogenase (NAD(P)+)
MFNKITIIGDGAMASVCAMLLCENGKKVTMWGYDAEQLAEFENKCENTRFLPGYKLPASLKFDPRDEQAMVGAELLVSTVPCQFMRSIWKRLKEHVPAAIPVVSVAKGIEKETLLSPSRILAEILSTGRKYMALSGPTIADELASDLPATACIAGKDETTLRQVQQCFTTPHFRVYTNNDIVGVELAGAVKNVIAIAAGIVDGVGAGDNAKAALVSRGLAEIERLGMAIGAKKKTFAGLSGLGDLVTTCISSKGRNRSFGERIGKGQTPQQALGATNSVVEGVATCESVLALASQCNVEMPIAEAVHSVIISGKSVSSAIHDLMCRQLKAE